VTDKIRSAAASLLFLVCVVTLTSAFNLPNRSPDLSSRLAALGTAAKPAQHRTMLTLADRIAYQRAIEEVYWRHRIWPKERLHPKPSLDEVMPLSQLEKKVEDYLRNSQALEDYWQRPLSAEQLQAEMNRMAQHTKQPEVLRELFQALGNDPFVIAECLARPVLAERLLTELNDEGRVRPTTVVWRKVPLPSLVAGAGTLALATTAALDANYTLPAISSPMGTCTDDTWTPTSITNAPIGRTADTAVWTGTEMIVWGGRDAFNNYFNTGGRYNPSTDSWTATNTTNAPSARGFHTAAWTGSEMIIWGGADSNGFLNTGGRYNPNTDSWTPTSLINAPAARFRHTAVWAGSEMIIWAGAAPGLVFLNTGGRYNPNTDSWTATSTINAPTARYLHTAVWTGGKMIVWGGINGEDPLNTGGRYDSGTDSWTATSNLAPGGRTEHTAVWTGSQMIIWGGTNNGEVTNTGGRYDPDEDNWTFTSGTNAPSARHLHTAVWTGTEMIIWGGVDSITDTNTGGGYHPGTDSWTATSTVNAPSARAEHTAVWTGSQMIVWGGNGAGGFLNTGGRYCVQSGAPMAQDAFSRKVHGAAGTFDIELPLTGNVGVECRSGGATHDYQMIVDFPSTVTVQDAQVTSGAGSVSSFAVSGSQVTVNLTGVTNVQRITVTLMNVNDGTHMGNVPVSMGVLVGDVNGNALVNASDVSLTKSQVGQAVSSSNFREDVNANGTISSTDVAIVKSDVGTSLPP
jgi:N-acetylneuraminic acid mutarotase